MGRPAIPEVAAGPEGPLPHGQLDRIEVTQSIQDLGHSVPLVAGKRTFVRVYLGLDGGALTVSGELRVRRGPGPWTIVPSLGTAALDAARSGSALAQLQSRRDNLGYSLNFRLPPRFTRAGALSVRLGQVRDAATSHVVPVPGPPGTTTVNFADSPPLRLRVINLRYTTGTPPVTYSASTNDLLHLRSWLRRAYPIPKVMFTSVAVDATAAWPFTSGQANAQLAAIRALDMAGGGDRRTHYYGLVADGGGFMRGSAAGIPGTPDPSVVASGPTGASDWGWDGDGSYGDWYGGHELGHTFGRAHPGFCGESNDDSSYPFTAGQLADADDAFVGFDTGDAMLGIAVAALPGTGWHDVMTYCSTQWMSSYTYGAIRDRLVAEDALFAGPVPAVAGVDAVSGTLVHIAGVVNLTERSGSIEHVTPLPGPAPLSAVPAETRVVVRALADGATEDHPVEFKPDLCRLPGEDEVGIVDSVIALDPNTSVIDLLIDGTSVASFRVGAAPAPVDNLAVSSALPGVEGIDAGEAEARPTLSWDDVAGAADADVGERSYIVQASTDGGSTWTTLAVGAKQTSLELDPSDFADAEQVRFRVLATNGLSYSEVATADVPVEDL